MMITPTTKSKDSDGQAQADLMENLLGLCYLDWIKKEGKRDNSYDQE